jgi:hypothetical protein
MIVNLNPGLCSSFVNYNVRLPTTVRSKVRADR